MNCFMENCTVFFFFFFFFFFGGGGVSELGLAASSWLQMSVKNKIKTEIL